MRGLVVLACVAAVVSYAVNAAKWWNAGANRRHAADRESERRAIYAQLVKSTTTKRSNRHE